MRVSISHSFRHFWREIQEEPGIRRKAVPDDVFASTTPVDTTGSRKDHGNPESHFPARKVFPEPGKTFRARKVPFRDDHRKHLESKANSLNVIVLF